MAKNFKTNYGSVIVDDISVKNSKDWKIIQSDTYKPDRGLFVLNKFKADFPAIASTASDEKVLYALCSRSAKLGDWLRETNAQYVLEIAPPLYLKELVSPSEYDSVSSKIVDINISYKELSIKQTELVNKFNADMAEASASQSRSASKALSDPLVKVLVMNSTALPITLSAMIEKYSPSETSSSPDKKTYAREVLVSFKLALIKFIKDPSFKPADFDKLLDELAVK